jgi:uncharacterized protein (UPF0303 family)
MTAPEIDLAELEREEAELQLDRFTNDDALALGLRLVDAARAAGAGVTVSICRGEQRLFHHALAGTSADNDAWIERKNRVVRRFGHSSLLMRLRSEREGRSFNEQMLLDPAAFAAHGGAFPLIVRDVGVVGTVTVSGLPQVDDHRLVVRVLRQFLRDRAQELPT